MPRAFSETEKLNIRSSLIDGGRKAFGNVGIKKTSVDDLAQAAGISKGAFYQFFASKEDLYFAIIREYENRQQQEMSALLAEEGVNDRTRLKTVMSAVLMKVGSDPFFRRLLSKAEFEYLRQKFTPEQLEEAMQADVDFSRELIEIWRQKGKLLIDDPRLVAGVFRSLFFLFLHKEDIGKEIFNDVIELHLDSAVERLIRE